MIIDVRSFIAGAQRKRLPPSENFTVKHAPRLLEDALVDQLRPGNPVEVAHRNADQAKPVVMTSLGSVGYILTTVKPSPDCLLLVPVGAVFENIKPAREVIT